ncbi:hypothetical protein K439DRAFT_1619637 [Ramaria rubella]|nr:hypothetical protein K439DRAFT_1619637 [Ramaria rubella]
MSVPAVNFRSLFTALIHLTLRITRVVATPPGGALRSTIGNGLVDITALTTLIGSSTAESLILGERGFGGLAWATTSAFGALSVIKGCIAGASANWLRETLGIRNGISDNALGLSLLLNRGMGVHQKSRRNLGEAQGIMCRKVKVMFATHKFSEPKSPGSCLMFAMQKGFFTFSKTIAEAQIIYRDIYAFDRATKHLVNNIPPSRLGDPLVVYTFVDYDFIYDGSLPAVSSQDWVAILSSLPKLVELYVLWRQGAVILCWVGGVAWLYFFIAAILLWLKDVLRSRTLDSNDELVGLDIVSGNLPTTKHAGGERKIILGASDNTRHSLLQRSTWAIGSVVCIVWLVTTYITLGQCDVTVVYTWAGFQLLWLTCRILFHQFTEVKDPVTNRLLPIPTSWENMNTLMKDRTLELTVGLAEYQSFLHPRGSYSYKEEVSTAASLRSLFSRAEYHLQPEFPLDAGSEETTIEVSIVGIVGDPILTSAAWMQGSKLNGMDLYDSCIIFFEAGSCIVAIPSARVLSQRTTTSKQDIERTFPPRFPPKSSPNSGHDITWWHWVPCGNDRWLQIESVDMKLLGKRQATVTSDAQVTKRLQLGDLNIALTKVEDQLPFNYPHLLHTLVYTMLFLITFTLSTALLSSAQATVNNTQLGVEAIEAHFANAGLVPSLLNPFSPSGLLNVTYNNVGQVQPGQNLTVARYMLTIFSISEVKPIPELSVVPANSSFPLSGNYTLAMIDAGPVGADETKGQTRHWLVNDVILSGNNVVMDHSVNITNYASPLPPPGTGAHRYVTILLSQPSSFAPKGNSARPNEPVGIFNLNQYITSNKLIVFAATYFNVEQGSDSASASLTSAVVTSTLPAATVTTSSTSSTSSAQSTSPGRNAACTEYTLNVSFAGILAIVGLMLAA